MRLLLTGTWSWVVESQLKRRQRSDSISPRLEDRRRGSLGSVVLESNSRRSADKSMSNLAELNKALTVLNHQR